MSNSHFYKRLITITAIVAVILFGFHQLPGYGHFQGFSFLSLAFFVLLSIAMFHVGINTADSANKNRFTSVIIGFVFGKLVLTVAILLIYHKVVQPVSGPFLIPFFIIYLTYTIFETHFMMRLGKVGRKP